MAVSIGSNALQVFLSDDSGQDLIEYALIAALIGVASVAILKVLGTDIGTVFSAVGNTLTSAL